MRNFPEPVQYLITLIEHHAKRYYAEDAPEISDAAYDGLVDQLRRLCKSYAIDQNSVPCLTRVGSVKSDTLTQVRLPKRMYSLDNAYERLGLSRFIERVIAKTADSGESVPWGLTFKLDGLALSLTYSYGRLVAAATRGDGITGDSVLAQVLSVVSIPRQLGDDQLGLMLPHLVIHGELYVTKANFRAYVQSPECPLDKVPKSPRTLVGSIRNTRFNHMGINLSFNPHYIADVTLDLESQSTYDLEQLSEILSPSLLSRLSVLNVLGFSVIPPIAIFPNGLDMQHIESVIAEIDDIRNNDSFNLPIDGLVLHLDNMDLVDVVGYTAKAPKWAIAYKFPALSATTQLLEVQWQVTARGAVVPVALFRPVEIGGHSYTNASLYNFVRFKSMQLHHGDMVMVSRQADVIPKITEVILPRSKVAVPIVAPKECPVCGSQLDVKGADLMCLADATCPEQIAQRILRYISKEGINLRYMGIKFVRTLIGNGHLRAISDIYDLPKLNLGLKNWTNFINEIEASKGRDLYHVLYGLGIPRASKKQLRELATTHVDLEDVLTTMLEKPPAGVSTPKALTEEYIVQYFAENQVMIRKLIDFNVGSVNSHYVDPHER